MWYLLAIYLRNYTDSLKSAHFNDVIKPGFVSDGNKLIEIDSHFNAMEYSSKNRALFMKFRNLLVLISISIILFYLSTQLQLLSLRTLITILCLFQN